MAVTFTARTVGEVPIQKKVEKVVLLPQPPDELYIHTGHRQQSGTRHTGGQGMALTIPIYFR